MAVQVMQAAPSTPRTPSQAGTVPGRWRVDADRSSVTFSARGFWGLVPVTGSFAAPNGEATVDQGGRLTGELVIEAATLSTGLAFRDRHLRGRDFFDVQCYPEITFSANQLIAAGGRCVVRGELSLGDRTIELELPIELTQGPGGGLAMRAGAVLEREPLGLGHSPLGMIRGPVEVRVDLGLVPGRGRAESSTLTDDHSPSAGTRYGYARS
jgi:3-(3-hydroxy-phenyl)propionate hydroxylase